LFPRGVWGLERAIGPPWSAALPAGAAPPWLRRSVTVEAAGRATAPGLCPALAATIAPRGHPCDRLSGNAGRAGAVG